MKRPHVRTAPCLFLVLAAGACSSPSGPVSPTLVDSPQTAVTITPDLSDMVSVPSVPGSQVYNHTPDGLLKYQFQLQNKAAQPIALQVRATFYDDQGTVVDDQLPRRIFLSEHEIETVSVPCANRQGRRVRVQVAPAR